MLSNCKHFWITLGAHHIYSAEALGPRACGLAEQTAKQIHLELMCIHTLMKLKSSAFNTLRVSKMGDYLPNGRYTYFSEMEIMYTHIHRPCYGI